MSFKEWGDYFAGGVWTTTDAGGKKEEISCEWILDRSFIRLTWKTGAESREEFHGIDPTTDQWTIWGFDSKGRVYNGIGESSKAGEWSYRTSGHGKDGQMSIKHKDVKLGPDDDRYEIQEFILDGKEQPTEARERGTTLIAPERAEAYNSRWNELKGEFVDEPRTAVRGANELVGQVLDELEELFRRQRSVLEQGLDTEQTSTEDLRLALGRYRSFFDRLLSF